MRFMVLGGGLAGVPTAWYLHQSGHEVTLIDRAPALAAEGSHANGAILHAGNAEPWNSPAVVGQLLRWIGREDSPLLLRPGQLPNLAFWGLRFLWHSRAAPYRFGLEVNTRLAVYSRQCMEELAANTGDGWDRAQRGSLKVCRSQRSLDEVLGGVETLRELGVAVEELDRTRVLAHEPALADGADDVLGGVYFPEDQSGDPCQFCRRLGARLEAGGAQVELGTSIQRLERDGARVTAVVTDRGRFTADRFVIATGVDAPQLVAPLGLRLPIRAVKGYAATIPTHGHADAPRLPVIDDDRKVVMAPLGNRLRVAGMAEFAGHDRTIHRHRVDAVVRTALAALPAFAGRVDDAEIEPWACLRPLMVDGRPLIGPTPLENLYLNTGAGHLGWTIAAGAGRLAADLACGQSPEIDPSGLLYERQAN